MTTTSGTKGGENTEYVMHEGVRIHVKPKALMTKHTPANAGDGSAIAEADNESHPVDSQKSQDQSLAEQDSRKKIEDKDKKKSEMSVHS